MNTRRTISLPVELYKEARIVAVREDKTFSKWVQELIMGRLKDDNLWKVR